MLPNRMQLSSETEEQLKKLKAYTGITPNIAARIAFFRSIESGFCYVSDEKKLDGALILDKATWLGDTALLTEMLLKSKYKSFDPKQAAKAWAAHVHDGISALRNHRSLKSFVNSI